MFGKVKTAEKEGSKHWHLNSEGFGRPRKVILIPRSYRTSACSTGKTYSSTENYRDDLNKFFD